MAASATRPEEAIALAGAARFFGDLLVVELDAHRLEALQGPEAAALLGPLGLTAPEGTGEGVLDELGAQFHAALLRPDGGGAPPIASLWTEGRYEGAIAGRIRTLAESAALEFDKALTRGAPVDHLGSILHLWAASVERAPWVADEIAEQHLTWIDPCLVQMAAVDGFYGEVAGVVSQLAREIRGTRIQAEQG